MQEILIKAGCYIAIIILGYVLRRWGFFGPEGFGVLSKVVLRVTLPCAIISSSAGRPIDASMLTLSLIGFGSGLTYIGFAFLVTAKRGRGEKPFIY